MDINTIYNEVHLNCFYSGLRRICEIRHLIKFENTTFKLNRPNFKSHTEKKIRILVRPWVDTVSSLNSHWINFRERSRTHKRWYSESREIIPLIFKGLLLYGWQKKKSVGDNCKLKTIASCYKRQILFFWRTSRFARE